MLPFQIVVTFLLSLVGAVVLGYPMSIKIKTKYARYVGQRMEYDYEIPGTKIKHLDIFRRVRYAEPPVRENRFQPPRDLQKNRGDQDATKPPPYCPQLCEDIECATIKVEEDEDCLFLNIYSPHELFVVNRTYPVMVYIHGGSYQLSGSRDYQGEALARFGVVFVSINYRLGLLGFLSTGDDLLPGNYGLLDQIKALKWIKENIGLFNGDPNKVTIVGNSAGSSAAQILITTPKAKGLFRYAISMSGSLMSYFAITPPSTPYKTYVKEILKVYECPTALEDGVKCLKKLPWRTIHQFKKYIKLPAYNGMDTSWRPRIDGEIIPQHPMEMIERGDFHVQKMLTGVTGNEVSRSYRLFLWDAIIENKPNTPYIAPIRTVHGNCKAKCPEKVPDLKFQGLSEQELKLGYDSSFNYFRFKTSVTESIKFFYTSGKDLSNKEQNRQLFIDVYNDFVMVAPTIRVADEVSKKGPTYLYSFNYFPENSSYDRNNISWFGAFHACDLDYLFGAFYTGSYPELLQTDYNGTDITELKQISANLMYMWTSFVKNGVPKTLNSKTKWARYTKDNGKYALIGKEVKIDANFRKPHVDFWNELVPKLSHIEDAICKACARPVEEGGVRSTEATPISANPVIWLLAGICVVLIVFTIIFVMVVRRQRYNEMKRRASRRASGMFLTAPQPSYLNPKPTGNSLSVPAP